MLAIGMSNVPSLSNMAAATFIPCILTSFLLDIQCPFAATEIAGICPNRNTLNNIIEEAAVCSMLDTQQLLMDQQLRIFVSSNHGNKKGLHHMIKVLSFWDKESDEVRRFVVDTDASGETSTDTADGIDTSLKKFDLPGKRILLAGKHRDDGGGGTK